MKIPSLCKPSLLRVILLSVVLIAAGMSAFAQMAPVRGTVSDTSGEPLVGVSVHAIGSNRAAVTDLKGQFELNVIGAAFNLTKFMKGKRQKTTGVIS